MRSSNNDSVFVFLWLGVDSSSECSLLTVGVRVASAFAVLFKLKIIIKNPLKSYIKYTYTSIHTNIIFILINKWIIIFIEHGMEIHTQGFSTITKHFTYFINKPNPLRIVRTAQRHNLGGQIAYAVCPAWLTQVAREIQVEYYFSQFQLGLWMELRWPV